MDTDELESILEGHAETPSVEFKGACSWNVSWLAKDILALSNVQDGGVIIIGVEDDTFKRQGVHEAQRQSFKVEMMRDQMAAFADPHVNFVVEFPSDIGGNTYVVIRVQTFEEIPVICRKDSKETQAGKIYYRASCKNCRVIVSARGIAIPREKRRDSACFTVGAAAISWRVWWHIRGARWVVGCRGSSSFR
jgi:predicted HTH transcriptional regulator